MTEKQRSKKTTPETGDAPRFEEALDELEMTIEKLESPDLTLDDSLQLFERGITLIRSCDAHLKGAQGKITELLKGENGAFVEKVLGMSLDSFVTKDNADE